MKKNELNLLLALRSIAEAVESVQLDEEAGRACYTSLRDALAAVGEQAAEALAGHDSTSACA